MMSVSMTIKRSESENLCEIYLEEVMEARESGEGREEEGKVVIPGLRRDVNCS